MRALRLFPAFLLLLIISIGVIYSACKKDDNNNPGSGVNPSWQCGDIIVDERDEQKYNTVQIGDQCWMAENLNIGGMINGTDDPVEDENIEKYCYNDLESNCDTYGGLYTWDEMMSWTTEEGTQGICMEGWHIPTDGEWLVLKQGIINTIEDATKLKRSPTLALRKQ